MSLSTTLFSARTLRRFFTSRSYVSLSLPSASSSRPFCVLTILASRTLSDASSASFTRCASGFPARIDRPNDSTTDLNRSSATSMSRSSSSLSSAGDVRSPSLPPRSALLSIGHSHSGPFDFPVKLNFVNLSFSTSPGPASNSVATRHISLLSPRAFFHHMTRDRLPSSSLHTRLPSNSPMYSRDHPVLITDERNSVLTISARFKSKDKGGKSKGKGGKGGGGRVRFDESFSEVVDHHMFQSEIDEALDNLAQDLEVQCTVKSGAAVFDKLEVNTVDGVFTLNELGTISQKSSSLVVVNMASLPNYIPDVVAAVNNSNLNVNPQQEGSKIMLPLPKVTKEHRQRLAAEAKKRLESMKVECRQIVAKHAKVAKAKKSEGASEDAIHFVELWLKQQMDEGVGKAEAVVKEKQEEVLDAGRG